MSAEDNKDLIRRYFAAIDTRELDIMDEFLAESFVQHNPFPGTTPDREGAKEAFRVFLAATPDGYHTVDDLVADGDKVAGRVTGYGKHSGAPLLGVPATGKDLRAEGIAVWRISNGKIVEGWNQVDSVGILAQLGALPGPGGSGEE